MSTYQVYTEFPFHRKILRHFWPPWPVWHFFAIWLKSTSEPIFAFLGTNPPITPPRPIYQKNGHFTVIKTHKSEKRIFAPLWRYSASKCHCRPFWDLPGGQNLAERKRSPPYKNRAQGLKSKSQVILASQGSKKRFPFCGTRFWAFMTISQQTARFLVVWPKVL